MSRRLLPCRPIFHLSLLHCLNIWIPQPQTEAPLHFSGIVFTYYEFWNTFKIWTIFHNPVAILTLFFAFLNLHKRILKISSTTCLKHICWSNVCFMQNTSEWLALNNIWRESRSSDRRRARESIWPPLLQHLNKNPCEGKRGFKPGHLTYFWCEFKSGLVCGR